jgi:AcrR family transcriptional regulator
MVTSSVSRRQRLRQQTLEEIHAVALQQVADGGAEAVSLNAIAKAMGMSGPGLYRYYASRDDLLAALVAAGYDRLAAALQVAVHAADGLPAEEQLGRVLHAYRDWAVANPRYYQFLFGVRPGGVPADSDATVDVVHGGMRLLEDVFTALVAPRDPASRESAAQDADPHDPALHDPALHDPALHDPALHDPAPTSDALAHELQSWSRGRNDPEGIPPSVLRLGVAAWVRAHGVVGLELTGALARMGLDPVLLLDDEVRRLIAEAKGAGASQRAQASEERTAAESRQSDAEARARPSTR